VTDEKDEIKTDAAGPTPTRAKRAPVAIPVKVIRSQGQSALVEWRTEDDAHRAYVPRKDVVDDSCPADILEAGAPFGVNWESALAGRIQDSMVVPLAKALRTRGIWESGDVSRNGSRVMVAIYEAANVPNAGTIHQAAREYETRKE
jgi:hypothetical protein